MSERELAERIIHLHDIEHLGFRKIADRLKLEGYKMSKDTANRLYWKYKSHSSDVDEQAERAYDLIRSETHNYPARYQPIYGMYEQQYQFHPMNHQHPFNSLDQLIRVMQQLYVLKSLIELMRP